MGWTQWFLSKDQVRYTTSSLHTDVLQNQWDHFVHQSNFKLLRFSFDILSSFGPLGDFVVLNLSLVIHLGNSHVSWDSSKTFHQWKSPKSLVHLSVATNGSLQATIIGLWTFFCHVNACFCREHSFPPLHFFFSAEVIFGLNALNGRVPLPDGSLGGPWNFTNAASLIRYTVNKGYTIHGWELGNKFSLLPYWT